MSKEPKPDSRIVILMRLLSAIDEGRHSLESLRSWVVEDGKTPAMRTMRRYLSTLQAAGFPFYFDRKSNRYRFVDGYSLRRLDLSNRELFGLVALRSLSESLGGTIAEAVGDITKRLVDSSSRTARAKMESAAPPIAFRVDRVSMDAPVEQVFSLLSAAERATRTARFSYVDKERRPSRRTVNPYGFIVGNGRIYCVGFDHARKAMRTFAIDNASDVETLGATFVRPAGFDIEAFAADSISGVLDAPKTTQVRVRFDVRVAKAAVAARAVAKTQIVFDEHGGAEITYQVADVDELVRWVLGWGAQAELLAPAAARRRLTTIAKALLVRYEEKA